MKLGMDVYECMWLFIHAVIPLVSVRKGISGERIGSIGKTFMWLVILWIKGNFINSLSGIYIWCEFLAIETQNTEQTSNSYSKLVSYICLREIQTAGSNPPFSCYLDANHPRVRVNIYHLEWHGSSYRQWIWVNKLDLRYLWPGCNTLHDTEMPDRHLTFDKEGICVSCNSHWHSIEIFAQFGLIHSRRVTHEYAIGN